VISILRFIKAKHIPILLLLFAQNISYSQNWNPMSTGTNGTVYTCLIVPGIINDLYIAGSFTNAGGVNANRIAKWNGNSWVPLGSGTDGPVLALAFFQGSIIAGGEFLNAGGVAVNRVAKWDGSSWSPLTLGTNDNVNSLCVYFNELRAGGKFTTAGGIIANRIATWDGMTWTAMGNGLNDDVYALAVYGNDLTVGGRFTNAGGISANRISKWNNTWSSLGAGMDNGEVRALNVFSGNIYAGGSFTLIGGVTVNHVAKWNGSNWSVLSSGTNDAVYSLYSSSAIGMLAIGGLFSTAGGQTANQVATWNGTSWGTLGNGMSGGNSPNVLCFTDYSAVLHAAGIFNSAGGQNANNVALWGNQPEAPVPISPSCGSQGQSLTPLLDWTSVSNASSYALQLSTNPNFTTTIIDVTGLPQSQYQVPNGLLSNNVTYYWRVSASNGLGISTYSSICWFSTLITSININTNSIPKEFKLYQNYPNPFNPSTLIKFDIPDNIKARDVKLTIYDVTGTTVSEIVLPYKPGSYEVSVNIYDMERRGQNGIASGIYFYNLSVASFLQSQKMVVIK
jgi:beta-propeller uncharacterized protein DUF5122